MKTYQLGVMYGDGIGQEIVEATLAVIKAANKNELIKLELEILPMGLTAIEKHGHPLPDQTKESLAKKDIMMNTGIKSGQNHQSHFIRNG